MKQLLLLYTLLGLNSGFGQLQFEAITLPNGREIGQINLITQDKAGYLWIGSQNGLFRYDAEEIVSASSLLTTEYTQGVIQEIYEDEKQNLWIGSYEGLFLIDPTRTYIRSIFPTIWNDKKLNDKPSVFNVLVHQDVLYFTHYFGLTAVDLKTHEHTTYDIYDKQVADNLRSTSFIEFRKNHLLIGTNMGICKFSLSEKTWKLLDISSEENINDRSENCVIRILNLNDTTLVCGTWASGIKFHSPESGRTETYLFNRKGEVDGNRNIATNLTLNPVNKNELFFSSRDKGLGVLNLNTKQFFFPFEGELKNEITDVTTLFFDRDNNLWVGTTSGLHLQKKNSSLFQHFFIHRNDNVAEFVRSDCFAMDQKNGILYIGTFDQGVCYWNSSTNEINHLPIVSPIESGYINELFFYNDTLLIFSQHVNYSYSIKTQQLNKLSNLPDRFIKGWQYDEDNLILARFMQVPVLFNLRSQTVHHLSPADSLSQTILSSFSSFYKVSDDLFYFGTYRKGLAEYDCKTGRVTVLAERYNNFAINDIYGIGQTSNQTIWFCAARSGLYSFDKVTGELKNYRTFDGSTINSINGVLIDNDQLWMASSLGLIHFTPNNIQAKVFGISDGLQDIHLSGEFEFIKNGTLLLPQRTGFSLVQTANLISDKKGHDLKVNSFKINDKAIQISNETELILEYDENNINVELALLSYQSSSKNSFNYFLEEYHAGWLESNSNSIDLYQLPPGNYTLHIQAFDANGTSSVQTIEIPILIKKPFWLRIWFWALVMILLLGAVVFIYQYRIRQLKKIQGLRNKIAGDLHDEIGSALSSIKLYAGFGLDEVSDDQKELLTKIYDTANESVENMSDIVWSINPTNDSLERIFVKMKSFSDNMLPPMGISITYNLSPKNLSYSMEQRRQLYLFYKEAINNIVKHSQATQVSIQFEEIVNHWTLIIKDNGRGFDQALASAGNGLTSLQNRARLLQAELRIITQPNHGTEIRLML